MLKNYAGRLHNIVVEKRNPTLSVHDVCSELEEDARRGLLCSSYFECYPEYRVIMDNISVLKTMGFKLYVPITGSQAERLLPYVTVSWAEEGELDIQGLKEL